MLNEINIDPLDSASIDRAIKEIRDHEAWVKKKSMELCKRLAELGLEIAKIYFIPEPWIGNTDVELSVEPVNNGYVLKASGTDVCFMEFGTGVTAGLGYDTSVITPPVDISPGSWSKAHGGMFMKTGGFPNGYWFYNGQVMNSTIPQMGMYHAASETKQRVEQIAQEVFGS